MPIGLRGVGKTVLLNRFAEVAEHEGLHVAFIEAPETGDFRTLLAIRMRKVLLALNEAGPARRLIARALGALRSFSYQLPDGSSISIAVEAVAGLADSGVLAEDITDLLVLIGEAARADRTGLLVAIDEVQYLSAEELAALITAVHRTTQLDLPIVLVGAGLPQLPGLAGDAKSYAERLFDFPTIGSLDPTDASNAIEIPARSLGVEFERRAVAEIVERSKGYPYFLQEWGSHVWNLAGGSPITFDDVNAARPFVTTGVTIVRSTRRRSRGPSPRRCGRGRT